MLIVSVYFFYIFLLFMVASTWIFAFKALNIMSFLSIKDKFILFSTVYLLMCFCAGGMMTISCGYFQISALNDILETNIKYNDKSVITKIMTKAPLIYDKICDLHDSISAFYVVNNLFFVTGLTYFYVYLTYAIYVYINFPSNSLLDFLLSTLLWCVYYTPCAIWLITLSNWTQNEGLRTATLVQQLSEQSSKLGSLKRSHIFSLQVKHRNPKITTELFDINWKTLFVLIGGVFSCSIILIQFHDIFN